MDQKHKGTDVARQLYAQQGLEGARMLFESESRNTAENVALSKALLKPKPGETWVLVTSAFHMPRSMGIFCKAGWAVVAYPVDHRALRGRLLRLDAGVLGNLNNLSIAIKEWLGLAGVLRYRKDGGLVPGRLSMIVLLYFQEIGCGISLHANSFSVLGNSSGSGTERLPLRPR